jgi:hypothetical protein
MKYCFNLLIFYWLEKSMNIDLKDWLRSQAINTWNKLANEKQNNIYIEKCIHSWDTTLPKYIRSVYNKTHL